MKHEFKIGDWVYDNVNRKVRQIAGFDHVGDFILQKQGATYKKQCRLALPHEIPIEFRKQQYYFY